MENNSLMPAMSESIDKIAVAMAKAQSEMDIAGLDGYNPFFKSKYATLPSLIKHSRPALAKNNIMVIMPPVAHLDGCDIQFIYMVHSSGQWFSGSMKIDPPKKDIQSYGSYMSYVQRYLYKSIVGIVTGEEDDDGQKATEVYSDCISQDQVEQLENELKGHTALTNMVLQGLEIQKISQMPRNKFQYSIKRIRDIKSSQK